MPICPECDLTMFDIKGFQQKEKTFFMVIEHSFKINLL